MRCALSLALLAGCSFEHGTSPATAMHDAPITPGDDAADVPDGTLGMIDGAVDARTCPSDFTPVTGGQATSRYKFYGFAPNSTIVDFPQATTTCTQAGGYVAIPNNASELAAFETISQNPSQPGYWVGISDAAVEGTWRTVLGDVATYLPWKPAPNAQPNGGAAANCAVGFANELYDVDCAMATYVFICECSL